MVNNVELVLRLILAAVIGGFIGMEREVSNRPAGLRTHILVTVGSALITLVSKDAFGGIGDPSRIAAQIVTGIGFLGAGTIIKTGNSIKGLTTAASLWITAGIGMAIGSGYYLGGLVTAAIVLLTLINVGSLEKKLIKRAYGTIEIFTRGRTGLLGEIGTVLGDHQIYIKDIRMLPIDEYENLEELAFEITVKMPDVINMDHLFNCLYNINNVYIVNYNGKEALNTNYTG
jgi:putative Mg2+ transporter-C (MgtC) family protein